MSILWHSIAGGCCLLLELRITRRKPAADDEPATGDESATNESSVDDEPTADYEPAAGYTNNAIIYSIDAKIYVINAKTGAEPSVLHPLFIFLLNFYPEQTEFRVISFILNQSLLRHLGRFF